MLPTTRRDTPRPADRDPRLTGNRGRAYTADIPVIPRAQFVKQFGKGYSQQHVTFIGPTQRGKTTLAVQLLSVCISPEDPTVILAGKPADRDPTMRKASELLNLRVIKSWPPVRTISDRYKKRNGYILKPLGKADSSVDEEAVLEREFRKALKSLYSSKKPVIITVDETSLIYEDLKLKKEYDAPLKRGAPIVAVWSLIQRGRHISYHAYDAPEHIFIFYDADESNRIRYAQIGGVDPKLVQQIAANLECRKVATGQTVSQALYIERAGPSLSIVDID